MKRRLSMLVASLALLLGLSTYTAAPAGAAIPWPGIQGWRSTTNMLDPNQNCNWYLQRFDSPFGHPVFNFDGYCGGGAFYVAYYAEWKIGGAAQAWNSGYLGPTSGNQFPSDYVGPQGWEVSNMCVIVWWIYPNYNTGWFCV